MDKKEISVQDESMDQGKRRFLKTVGKAAVVAPAVGLLLAVNTKAASAQVADPYTQAPPQCPAGSVFNPLTGRCVQLD